jgi:hypothetical protein
VYGLEQIGLRYFNVFGPRQDPNGMYSAVIPKWTNDIINNLDKQRYLGLFTRHTNTIFKPYLETTYLNTISDDRANFFLNKNNKLYLYL